MLTIKDIAWAAGFLVGEGHFRAHQNGSSGLVVCGQVDPKPLHHLKQLFNGTVTGPRRHANPRAKAFFEWRLTGSAAVGLMMTIYSLLNHDGKEKQIKDSLQKWRSAKVVVGLRR